jgi:hypothetical protein
MPSEFKDIYTNIGLHYYTDLPVEPGDTIVVETKNGYLKCAVGTIIRTLDFDPFKENEAGVHAKCHVLENSTKKLYYKESIVMFGSKVVEVKHIGSNRTGLFYTDLELSKGDLVVYEAASNYMADKDAMSPSKYRDSNSFVYMHVGEVIDTEPNAATAKFYIVDKIDMQEYAARKVRIAKAQKIHLQLEAKKKQFQDIQLLELIAASDPETKTMLDEYKILISGVNTTV